MRIVIWSEPRQQRDAVTTHIGDEVFDLGGGGHDVEPPWSSRRSLSQGDWSRGSRERWATGDQERAREAQRGQPAEGQPGAMERVVHGGEVLLTRCLETRCCLISSQHVPYAAWLLGV